MNTNILAIIPARYQSSRFPGKPLALINGKPMIARVYEQASKVFDNVCVATDDLRILNAVNSLGGNAVMTSLKHQSGTDRCLEAYQKFSKENNKDFSVIINIQGDEPYIHPEQLQELSMCFNEEEVEIATLVKRIKNAKELNNPNSPKVIISKQNYALYFSRTPIPYARDKEMNDKLMSELNYFRHIGLYGYRAKTLEKICSLEQSFLERTEKLEQLRWLENGYKIKVAVTDYETFAVDTPEDMEFLNSHQL